MKMTFDEFDAKLEELSKVPNPKLSDGYGLTRDDIEFMRGNEEFVTILMVLATRPWYRVESHMEREFYNEDALSAAEASELIDELLYEMVELYDEKED